MPDLDRIFDRLQRRARRSRLLSAFGRALPITAGVLVALALTLQAFGVSFAARALAGPVFALLSLVSAIVCAFLLNLRPIDPARLFFALDAQVDGEGRLSSLHELRSRRSSEIYERALAPLVSERADRYVAALRIDRRSRMSIGAGMLVVALLLTTPSIGAALHLGASAPGGAREGPKTPVAATQPADHPEEEAETPTHEPETESDPQSVVLDDVLDSLRSSRSGPEDEIVDEQPTGETLNAASASQPETFAGFLFDLSQRLESGVDARLSDAERDLITEILPEVDDALAADLEDLLTESDSGKARETIERLLQSGTQFPDVDTTPLEADAAGEVSDDLGGVDASGAASHPPASQETAEGGDAASETAGTGESEDGVYPITDFGEEEGVPELVEAEIATELGESGDLTEYITQGVPIEPPDGAGTESSAYVVDFERIRSILDGRSIPSDAYETVKRYFETITEGGS